MRPIAALLFLLSFTVTASAQDSLRSGAADSTTTGNGRWRSAPPKTYGRFPAYPPAVGGAHPYAAFVPRGWTLRDTTQGDLNGDGRKDLVLVLQYNDTVRERLPGGYHWECKPRVLRILFCEKAAGSYRLALQNNHILPRAGTGKQGGDPLHKLVVKSRELELGGEMGGRYYFKYSSGDFFLVRAWTNGRRYVPERGEEPAHHRFYYVHIDHRTGRVRTEEDAMDGGETPPVKKQRFVSRRPLLRLRDLKAFDERRLFRGLAR